MGIWRDLIRGLARLRSGNPAAAVGPLAAAVGSPAVPREHVGQAGYYLAVSYARLGKADRARAAMAAADWRTAGGFTTDLFTRVARAEAEAAIREAGR